MELARLRCGALALAFSTLLAATSAHAKTAEARAAISMRDRPNARGKVVGRIASGAQLTLIATSDDGAWAHVRTKSGHEGWVPTVSVQSKESADPETTPPPTSGTGDEPLAKHRDVRPESWVSKSKYHEDNERMTVVATKTELFGRPQAGGTVVGLLRRGEVVDFVRRSPDKKWIQVDMGAGELAWVDASAVRMGAAMPSSTDEDRAAKREADRQRDRDRPAPQVPRSTGRVEAVPADTRNSARDDATPPPDPPESRAPDARDRRRAERKRVPAHRNGTHGPNYIDAQVTVGFGRVGEQVRTNSVSVVYLRSYQHLTTGLAIGARVGYTRALTEHLRLHVDFKYTVIAAGSVRYSAADGSSTQLQVLDQNIGGGVAFGGWWDVAGGIDLRLRVGVDAWIDQISPSDPPLALSQNVVLGMKIGGVLAMPALLRAADRPLGLRVQLGALAPATRIQQANLLTAPHDTTVGGYFGVAAFYGLIADPKRGQLHLQLGYDLDFAFSHFRGACRATTATARQCRDDTVTDANYSSVEHVGTIGVLYQR